MLFQVKVRVNPATITEFAQKLQTNQLDRSAIRGETYCLKNDPAVGFSYWETETKLEFEEKFEGWKKYYTEAEVTEMITPIEAMYAIISKARK